MDSLQKYSRPRNARSRERKRQNGAKPVLVLHVGQTKSGSTAIQNYLDSEREALRERGIWVPKTGFTRANPFQPERTAGHLELVRLLARNDRDEIDAERDTIPHTVCVVSAENLFSDRPDEELQALREYFSSYDVQIVALMRHTANWLTSRYVEECLSGFSNDIRTFEEFCADCAAAGTLDYAARLDHLKGILSPHSTTVINYDAVLARGDLVETFCDDCGFPVTNPDSAHTIRANEREKYLALVEGKRRLNYIARSLPIKVSLEFEALLRSKIQQVTRRATIDRTVFHRPRPPLSQEACSTIEASNRRLVTEFDLDPAFETLQAAPGDPFSHRSKTAGIADEVVFEGLSLLARLVFREGSSAGSLAQTWLSRSGAVAIIDVLAKQRNSLHIGDDLSATIAAMFTRRSVAFAPGASTRRSHVDALLALRLPSEIMCVDSIHEAALLLVKDCPETIFCGGKVDADTILIIAEELGKVPIIVLTAHDELTADKVARVLSASVRKCGEGLWIIGEPYTTEPKSVEASENDTKTSSREQA